LIQCERLARFTAKSIKISSKAGFIFELMRL
jgi:hypothetical protein